jgi:hypothetical protein
MTYYWSYRMANSEELCHGAAEGGGRLVEMYTIFTRGAEACRSWPHRCRRPCLGSGEASEFVASENDLVRESFLFFAAVLFALLIREVSLLMVVLFDAGRAFYDAFLFRRFGTVAYVTEWHSSTRYSNSGGVLRPT